MAHTATTRAPVEAKVQAATWAATAVGIAVTLLNALGSNSSLLDPLPPWLQDVITVVIPPLITFLSGWGARHTPRTTGAGAGEPEQAGGPVTP